MLYNVAFEILKTAKIIDTKIIRLEIILGVFCMKHKNISILQFIEKLEMVIVKIVENEPFIDS